MKSYNVLVSFNYCFKEQHYSLLLHKGFVKTLKDIDVQVRLGKVIAEPTDKKVGSAFVYITYPNGNVYSDIMCLAKKKVTQKRIDEALRNGGRTEIFKIVKEIYGAQINHGMVYDFIRANAPTNAIADKAYSIAYDRSHDDLRMRCLSATPFIYKEIIEYMLMNAKDTNSPYCKRPSIMNGELVFCSLVYGERDYNKFHALKYDGNEHFCDVIVKWWDKNVKY